MRPAVLAVLLIAALVGEAGADTYAPTPDLSGYATTSSVATTAAAAAQAAVPQPCSMTPLPDTLLGAAGTGTPCMVRADTARPTVVQAANVVTDGSGNWSVTWAKAFTSSSPAVNPLPVNTGTLPIMCNVQTRSSTGATGRCWQANTTTLGGTLAGVYNATINAFTSGAANTPVMVIAREPTQ